MADNAPGTRWVVRAITEVLAARRAGRSADAVPPPASDDDVVAVARAHRVVPVVSDAAADLGAPPRVRTGLHRAHLRSTTHGLAVAADSARVSQLLAGADVPHLVCKGAALDALLGHPPGARGAGDVDVWVALDGVAAAVGLLHDAGWPRRSTLAHYPEPADGRAWRLLLWGGKELPFDRAGATSVDLHWRLTSGHRHLSFDFGQARRASVPVAIGATVVPTLATAHALEHMAAHGRKEAWPYLRQLVDVVELAGLVGDDRAAEIAAEIPEVAAAFAVAAHLAPWLRDLTRVDGHAERMARDAWRGCLALDRRYHVRMALRGPAALRASVRHEWWLWRSAPDRRSRSGYAPRGALWLATHRPGRRTPSSVPSAGQTDGQ